MWTREAGAGQLAISLEGPSKAEIDFKDRKDGSCDVSYKVEEPGKFFFVFYSNFRGTDSLFNDAMIHSRLFVGIPRLVSDLTGVLKKIRVSKPLQHLINFLRVVFSSFFLE